jgi:hypothetical protein
LRFGGLSSGSGETQNIQLLLNHPWWLVMRLHTMGSVLLQHREFVQTDILDRRPDNHQATGLRREHVNLISALAHITEETLKGIGGLNMPMHSLRKGINEVGSQRVASTIDPEERFSKVVTL